MKRVENVKKASPSSKQLTLIKQHPRMFKDNFITVARANKLRLKTKLSYWSCAAKHIKRLGARTAKDLEKNPTMIPLSKSTTRSYRCHARAFIRWLSKQPQRPITESINLFLNRNHKASTSMKKQERVALMSGKYRRTREQQSDDDWKKYIDNLAS